MAGIDTATGVQFASGQAYADSFMTNFMVPVLADARNNSSVLWSMLKKQPHTPVSGRFIVFPVRFGRNTGSNAVRESYTAQSSPDLPDPGAQGGKNYSFATRTMYGRVKLDGPTIRRGKTNGGAFIPISELEMQGIIDDMTVECNRMAHNDGSGRIAEYSSGTTTVTVRMNQSIEGVPTVSTPIADKYFEVGQRVAFCSAGGTIRTRATGSQTGLYVIAVTSTTIQLALTPGGSAVDVTGDSSGVTAGDWIVRISNDTASLTSSGFRSEPMGFGGIFCDDGALDGNGISSNAQQSGVDDFSTTAITSAGFQGLAATSANPFNRAVVLDNGGSGSRPLTEELLQQAFSDAEEINNANISILLSAYPAYNAYVKTLTPDKRYNDTLELKGGHKMLSFNGVAWVKDRFCYKNRVYMPNLEEFTVYEVEPLQPLAAFDVPRWERLANKDAYWAGWVTSYNLGVNVRNRCGAVLTELAA